LLIPKLAAILPEGFKLVAQGEIVAWSLSDYLKRHPEIESLLGRARYKKFFTTGDDQVFNKNASIFFDETITSARTNLKL